MPMKADSLGVAVAVTMVSTAFAASRMYERSMAEGPVHTAEDADPYMQGHMSGHTAHDADTEDMMSGGMSMDSMPAMEAPGGMATGADILNFALNLECLEAEFYSYAAYGVGLSAERRGGGPEATGGRKAMLSPAVQALAEEIAEDEIAHVEFLRGALGDAAVPCPAIDIGSAFVAAANAAAGAQLSPDFDPYANDVLFLHGAFIFEDVGVTAYRGAVSPLADLVDGDTLSAAAAILAVEAYHAGAVRALLADLVADGDDTPFRPVADVVQLISDLRDAVDGPADLDQGIGSYGEVNIVPADDDGLVFARSVTQVLAIVYLGGEGSGGFFPEGVTGFFGAQGKDTMGDGEAAACPGKCQYRLTFDMNWTPETHPIGFPMEPNGFVFPFWTVAHDMTFSMWTRGGLANPGIQQIAETGAGGDFMEEVAACGAACAIPQDIACDSSMSGECNGSGVVTVDSRRTYVSAAAMLAPSPDWFTGVDTWELCEGGAWLQSVSRPMAAYDAGTDVGLTFLSPNMPCERSPIFSFGQVTPPQASVFFNPATGAVAPVGTVTAELLSCS